VESVIVGSRLAAVPANSETDSGLVRFNRTLAAAKERLVHDEQEAVLVERGHAPGNRAYHLRMG
jgi:hypothetical protein